MGNTSTEKKKRRLRRKKARQRTESQKKRHCAYLAEIKNGQWMIQVDANHAGEMYMKQTVQCVILTKEIAHLKVINQMLGGFNAGRSYVTT